MNVGGIQEFLNPGTSGADRSLLLRTDEQFNLTLKLGQVLKGKVLRHYEGSRYGVSFGGQERVVDSASTLRIGEVIQGRVIGIDDKVHLQRILAAGAEQPQPANVATDPRDEITALFARYQVTLSPTQHNALLKLGGKLGSANLVGVSALILHKLGLPQETVLIQAVHQVLSQAQMNPGSFTSDSGPQLPAAAMAGAASSAVVEQIAPLLARLSEQMTTVQATDAQETADEQPVLAQPDPDARQNRGKQREWQLGQWLLNMQSEGSLAHRYMRIPVWLDDRMIEVSMALFSQHDGTGQKASADEAPLRHHKAVFSLTTENLGHVELEALIADRHLRLTVNTGREAAARILSEHLTSLTSILAENGWEIDEILYRVDDELSGVMQSVVEHHVTPDSLSQLL